MPAAEDPKLEVVTPAEAGDPMPRFFTTEQFSALRHLSAILAPSLNGAPGAVDCHAAEFLDFLCSESLPDRQQLYRAGLDALNAQSRQRFGKPFSGVDDAQANALLEPLRRPWTYDLPAEPLTAFLLTAKSDVRTATTNSREFVTAAGSGRRPPYGRPGPVLEFARLNCCNQVTYVHERL